MRGADETAGSLFSYADLEDRVPAKHPLLLIRRIVRVSDEKELAQHRRKETAIELHDRFNSSEAVKARAYPPGLTALTAAGEC